MHNTVFVTGGNSFFGKYVCQELLKHKYDVVASYYNNPNKNRIADVDYLYCNLTCCEETVSLIRYINPKYVIHLAGYNGNIQKNLTEPYEIFVQNTTMANMLYDGIIGSKVETILSVLASCSYPAKYYELNSNTFLDGEPNYTVECHGYAKRHLHLLSRYIRQQHKINAINACVTTLYGPNDSLDLNKTKVMMSLIKRVCDAKKHGDESVEVWGNGQTYRQFIYVKDAARIFVDYLQQGKGEAIYNIAPNNDILIKDLIKKIVEIVGYEGIIKYNTEKPNGQYKKQLMPNLEIDQNLLTPLDEGIKETVKWYKNLDL